MNLWQQVMNTLMTTWQKEFRFNKNMMESKSAPKSLYYSSFHAFRCQRSSSKFYILNSITLFLLYLVTYNCIASLGKDVGSYTKRKRSIQKFASNTFLVVDSHSLPPVIKSRIEHIVR